MKFYYKILIKCAQTQLFVSFEQSFCIFQHFVTYYVRYFVRFDPDPQFKAAGSGSALRRTAGSGSAKNECGSTALVYSIGFVRFLFYLSTGTVLHNFNVFFRIQLNTVPFPVKLSHPLWQCMKK